MAITVQRIASEAALKFKDFDAFTYPTAPTFLNYLNDVHSMILMKVKLYPDVSFDITVDGVNREFAYDSTILKIWNATFFSSAKSFKNLRPSSIDELDYDRPNWRQVAPGTPYLFYESGGNVGFHPIPPTPTSGSYPKITLYTQVTHTLAAGDSLPSQVKNPWAWVYGTCWLWAKSRHPELAEGLRGDFLSSIDTLIGDIYKKAARGKEYANFNTPRINH